jgi:isoamylase
VPPGSGSLTHTKAGRALILNGHWEPQRVLLPKPRVGSRWYRLIDTSLPAGEDLMDEGREVPIDPPDHYFASPRSTVVLLGI